MSIWDDYAARCAVRGTTKRGAALRRLDRYLGNKLPDNLSYQSVLIGETSVNVAIIRSDNLNEKYIYSMPGETLDCGVLVFWEDYYWLITEVDAANEVYQRGIMLQCNYLLKWIDDSDVIHEQWCIVEDGTKLKRVTCTRNSLAYWKRYVKTTPLIAGNPLEPNNRNGAANSRRRYGLRTVGIGQSAAKSRKEEGSTTIPAAGTGTSVPKRGALNRHRRQGEDIVCAPVKAGGVRIAHRRGVATVL